MDSPAPTEDLQMGDAEILEAFKAMGPLLLNDKFVRDPGTEKEPKKHKRNHVPENTAQAPEVTKLVRLMGSMILRLDAEHQLMKRQDSFVFFLQTEEPALLPQLLLRAKAWHAQMKQRVQQPGDQPPYVPLRTVLFQDMATLLEDRVQKLSKANSQDPLWVTATTHGVLTSEGNFPFQRWCQQQKSLVLTKKDPDQHEPHVEVHGTDETNLTGPGCNPEVSCVETGGDQLHSTVDPSNRNAARRDPTVAGNLIGVHGMGPHWCYNESTHTGGQPTESRAPATSGEGQGKTVSLPMENQGQRQAPEPVNADASRRQSLRARFEVMQLINLENWCYANTALVTLLWALLSCRDISLEDWGTLSQHIVHFIQHETSHPIHLPDVVWFQNILRSWHGDGAQCDPVEFLTHLVTGLDIPGLNWTWERRVQMGEEISIRDTGDRMTPITLYVDPELSHAGWIRLDSLIHSWHNYMGMQTALTQDTPLLCFHIDRHVLTGDGNTSKSDLSIGMHGVFGVPCYTDHSLDITWHDYKVIAAIAHLGTDQAGHCRATLRVQADQRNAACPYMQLLTDDNVTPSRCWHEPPWFLQNVMCIWLCKMSAIDLHICDPVPVFSAEQPSDPTTAQLMRLLRKFG